MSNVELINMNSNESIVCDVPDEESVVNDKGGCNKLQNNIKTHASDTRNSSDESMIVNEGVNQKVLLGLCKNVCATTEKDSNIFHGEERCSNELNENFACTQKEDKCLKSKLNFENKEKNHASKATTNMVSFAKENITREQNSIDIDNKTILDTSGGIPPNENVKHFVDIGNELVQGDNSQPVDYFNIVPDPNEFNWDQRKSRPTPLQHFANLNQAAKELIALSDNSIVISNSNAIPQSDNIVSSNYSLSQLLQYGSDDDDECSMVEDLPLDVQKYRENNVEMEDSDDDSDSSTSSSTSIIISDSSSDSESEEECDNTINKPVCKPIKARGELDLCDLPPIEDLTISVPEEECIPVGKIYQIVDQLVIVQANKDTPAYDLDTVLFTQGGKPLGKVFDVMGPVTEPYYCIRFNSKDHIEEKNITLDQTVYAAPNTQYSKFVFLAQLMQLKGSDASWEHDIEPPEIYLDYSDDEQEQRAKKKQRNKKATSKAECDADEPARKKHSAYEKKMNARNLKLSAARNNQTPNRCRMDGNAMWQPNLPPMCSTPPPARGEGLHQMFGRPPMHDRVPLSNPRFFTQHRTNEFSPYSYNCGPSTSHSRGPSPAHQHIPPGPHGACHSSGPSNGSRISSYHNYPSHGESRNHFPETPPDHSSWNSSFPNPNPHSFPPRPVSGSPSTRVPTPPYQFPSGPFTPQRPPTPRPFYRGSQYNFNPPPRPPPGNFY